MFSANSLQMGAYEHPPNSHTGLVKLLLPPLHHESEHQQIFHFTKFMSGMLASVMKPDFPSNLFK